MSPLDCSGNVKSITQPKNHISWQPFSPPSGSSSALSPFFAQSLFSNSSLRIRPETSVRLFNRPLLFHDFPKLQLANRDEICSFFPLAFSHRQEHTELVLYVFLLSMAYHPAEIFLTHTAVRCKAPSPPILKRDCAWPGPF